MCPLCIDAASDSFKPSPPRPGCSSANPIEKRVRPRVLLADDHAIVIEQASALLQYQYEIVGVAYNGGKLISEATRLQPDVIVADISMPELSGIEAAHRLREAGSAARFVFLTVHERVEFVRACLAEGAFGYVIKSRLLADLVPAVADALAGIQFISSSIAGVE